MEIPKPKTEYVFDNDQDKRIFEKLGKLANKNLTNSQEKIVTFLFTQLEKDWRNPLEIYVDELLKK